MEGKESIEMKKKKLLMYVYSDIKTDARVMRSIDALKKEYDITLIATNSGVALSSDVGFQFIDAIDNKIGNPFFRYVSSLFKFYSVLRRIKPDIIYGHDYYAAPIIAYGSKKYKLVYDAHELYMADKTSSKREKVCCYLEKRAIGKADQVICASERRKEIMNQHYSVKREICVVNNVSILPRINDNKVDEAYFSSDERKVVVYCGALIKPRRVDLLIEAANKLKSSIRVLIVGNGEELGNLKNKANTEKIDNVTFINAVPYKSIWSIVSKCDIGYLYYENDTLNNANCAPNKVYEYASAGLVMVANENLGLSDIFNRYCVGVSSNDLCLAIKEVLENYDTYKKNVERFIKDCSWEVEGKKLSDAISTL